MKTTWVSITGVASALGFIIGICFTKLYGMCREKCETLGIRRSSTTVVGEDNTGTLEITTTLTQTSQPDEASLPPGAVSNQPLVEDPQLDLLHSGRRSHSSLPASLSMVKTEDNSTSHLTNIFSGANSASSGVLGKSGQIYEKSGGTPNNDERSRKTHAPSTVSGSGPSQEITYCSLDDVDVVTSKTEMEDLPSSIPMPRILRFNGNKGCKSSYSIKEGTPSSSAPTGAQEDESAKPMIDMEALYAKPDMSRKARKMHRSAASRGVTEQHGQGDRGNLRIAINQTNRVVEHDVGSDILVGPIYGNSASILNLNHEFPGEDALYVNSYGSQDN